MEGERGSSFGRLSSVWTRNGHTNNVFSRSTREVDDEEALKWAAIERLPTLDRLRKGLLATSKGSYEVDVEELSFNEKRMLLERILKETRVDNEKFLRKVRRRVDRVGIQLPTVEVRFEHLCITGDVHVGSRAKVNIVNSVVTTVEDILAFLRIIPSKKVKFDILKDASGVIRPSRLTLLLGPPSSGKTTFLLALAGKLDPSLKVTGNVTYNGHTFNEFEPQRTAAYVSQYDNHIPEITVRETVTYSARFQGVGARHEMLQELSRREKAAGIQPDPDIDIFMKSAGTPGCEASLVTDYVIKILGLTECADIIVGNQIMRGISGGQRKRLTTAEVMVGPATVLFMDEISTGLDSSTTFEVINCLKQIIQIMDGTAMISLLQPAPETFNLFDDVILISDGLIVYQGPIDEALPFFEHVGFKCPQRKGFADFLQEVTSKNDQQQYWFKDEPYRFITARDFVEAFQGYSTGKCLAETLAQPFDKSKSHPAALITTKYGATWQELLRASTEREILLMKKNFAFYMFKFAQLTFLGFLYMTIFLRTKFKKNTLDHGLVYSAVLFLCTSIVMFNGIAEVPAHVDKLSVFYKQRGLRFFPAWVYALPKWILTIPISFFDMIIFTFIPYYVIGFDSNFGRATKMFMLLVALNQVGSSLFRLIASVCRNMIVANTLGAFQLMILIISGGFVTSKDSIKSYWKWAYYINPMMYGQSGLMVNEFLGHSWKKIIPPYTETLGVLTLKIKRFSRSSSRYWVSLLIMVISVILINVGNIVALTYLHPYKKVQVANVDADDDLGEMKRNDEGKKKGMVLPFEPQTLTFEDIVYSVDMPAEMRLRGATDDRLILLRGISGCFRPGVLTALMGVSGAGKTTLMDVLAGRKTGGYIEGSVNISGRPKKQDTFARIAGYCEQNDIHSPCLTVYESLVFSAWLRLSSDIDEDNRKRFVEEVMDLVELHPIRDLIVGVPGMDGLSTEQRKRLTIAVELVANPSIIFMDEPTSGLDARAAAIVMRTVRNTVDTGRTVVCTIHQPSIDIFESFDELILLKRGGEEIYVGPLGRLSCDLVAYFEGIEGVAKIVDDYNPAAWMLEVTTPAQEDALQVDFAEIYKKSDLYTRTKETIREHSKPAPGSVELHFDDKYAHPFLSQCSACLWKHHRSYWSNPPYNSVRLVFTLFIALIFGSMFWDLGSKTNTTQDMSNAFGSMYASLLFMGFINITSVQPVVSIERAVFYRERVAGMYSPFAYAFGQSLIEIPYVFVQSMCFVVIIYPMMSFDWTASKFFWYLGFVFTSMLFFTYFGMASVAITPTQEVALLLANIIFALGNVFSGFIIPRPATPIWWRWYCYVSPNAWSLYGLLTSQYGENQNVLEDGKTVAQYLKHHFGFHHDMLGEVFIIVCLFISACALLFCIGIKYLQFQTR